MKNKMFWRASRPAQSSLHTWMVVTVLAVLVLGIAAVSQFYPGSLFKTDLTSGTSGTVWAWGYNMDGYLGDGTTTNQHTPVQVQNLSNVRTTAAGDQHRLALKNDGTVWTWGPQWQGVNNPIQPLPVQVQNLSNITAIAAGESHSLALKNDGTVWAWGLNNFGQLGDGTTTDRSQPVQVQTLNNITAIAAGSQYGHSLALKNDGTVWAWGQNNYGQLGDSTTINRSQPVQVRNLTGSTSISAGSSFSLALKNDGTVWAWGWNGSGQLGDGTKTVRSTPVQIQNLSNVSMISAGAYHSLALKNDGIAWSWGYNSTGQLGDGTTTQSSTPVSVRYLGNIVAISAGTEHSLAIRSDGTAWAWGRNGYGELGDNTNITQLTPVRVQNLTNPTDIQAGRYYSMAVAGTTSNNGNTNSTTYSLSLTPNAIDPSNVPVDTPVTFTVTPNMAVPAGYYLGIYTPSGGTIHGSDQGFSPGSPLTFSQNSALPASVTYTAKLYRKVGPQELLATSNTVTVTWKAASSGNGNTNNQPPSVQLTATPSTSQAPVTPTVSAQATDPEGNPLSYTFRINNTPWFFEASRQVVLSGPAYDYNSDGYYDVLDSEVLNNILAGNQGCPAGKNCDVNGDGQITLQDVLVFTSDISTNSFNYYTFAVPGMNTISVTVTDYNSSTKTVYHRTEAWTNFNVTPTMNFNANGDTTAATVESLPGVPVTNVGGVTVALRATDHESGLDLANSYWQVRPYGNFNLNTNWNFNGRFEPSSQLGAAVVHSTVPLNETGDYKIHYFVKNQAGLVTEGDFDPYRVGCRISGGIASAEPSSGPSPVTVQFVGQATLTNCSTAQPTVWWTFGDGAGSSQLSPTHTFNAVPGRTSYTYPVTFTAQYGGGMVTATTNVTVTSGNQNTNSGGTGNSNLNSGGGTNPGGNTNLNGSNQNVNAGGGNQNTNASSGNLIPQNVMVLTSPILGFNFVNWTGIAVSGLNGYRVYRAECGNTSLSSCGTPVQIAFVPAPMGFTTDINATRNTYYVYYVSAVINRVEGSPSAPSNVIQTGVNTKKPPNRR